MLKRSPSAAQEKFRAAVELFKAQDGLREEQAGTPYYQFEGRRRIQKISESERPETNALLERLASDWEMNEVWKFLAGKSSDDVTRYLRAVVSNFWSAKAASGYKRALQKNRAEIERLACAIEVLVRSPLAALLRARVPTYGDAIRGAIDELCKIEEHDRRRLVLAPRQKGVVTVRAEFMRQMVRTTRTRFGKPRYEDVAAITNIVFRGEAPQADGRAVRRAVEKRRERLRKITPLRPQQFAVLGGTKNYPLAPSKKPLFGGAPLGSLSRNDGVGRSIAGDEAPA